MTRPSGERGTADGVLLDIGSDAGALVLLTDAGLDGAEIEVSLGGLPRTHAQVHPRRAGGGVRHAAVFPALAPGSYVLWRPDGSLWMRFEVAGGMVTELDLRA